VTQRRVTPDLVRRALAAIPADIDREIWVRVGMALKAELGSDGFDLWSEWSARAQTYSETDARDMWRSIKASGGVTIGTLFGIAKDHGFRFAESDGVQTPAQSAEDREREAEAKRRKRDSEAAEYSRRADEAARVAVRMWDSASDDGRSAYLVRKGVGAHGVRFRPNGTLLVPLRNAAGELQNLQRIAPGENAEKRLLPGGRKSGLWHLIGTLDGGATALLAAEGYATAATLHEATGRPVAVAFDAGNLVHVARSLRELHPTLPLLVCGDDDQATQERTGKNPGRDKAASAVRAAGGLAGAIFPPGLVGDGTDFNDLAATAGLEAVRSVVDQAAAALIAQPAQEGRKSPRGARKPRAAADDTADAAIGAPGRDPFHVNHEGVWFVARDAEGNDKQPAWLCSRLDVTARTRADDANGWGSLLEFADPDGNAKTWAMPSSMLSGEGVEWAARLRDMGLRMAPGTRSRNLVAQYIDTRAPAERVTCTDRVGWHGPVYVLPSTSIGTAEGRRYVFQSESGMEDTFRRSGELEQWQREVGALCVDNSRLVFAVCCALAGPMLRPAEVESGGVHFRGDSSQGKTTALKVAASVWGRPSYMQRWRTTDNALEATAVQHCDGLLILDEFGQLDPRVAGEVAYMLANDQEKGRATRGGLARKRRTWRLLWLSSGEVSLAQHMEAAAKTPRAGQEVRMLDIPLDAGGGMGGIEVLHGHDGPAVLADAIVSAGARFYGTPGRAWLEWACANHARLPDLLGELLQRYRDDMVPAGASEQVRRAGTRFGLIAAAGELATQAGVTGWKPAHAAWAVRQCFNAWLGARGHLDNGEDASMLRQARRFLELNGEGRFTWWHRAMDDHASKTLNRAGFRRLLDDDGKPLRSDSDHMREYGERMSAAAGERAQVDFIVLREVFRKEVCQGFDADAVAKLLQRRGHLEHEKDRLTIKHRLPGIGKAAAYHIRPSIFDDEL